MRYEDTGGRDSGGLSNLQVSNSTWIQRRPGDMEAEWVQNNALFRVKRSNRTRGGLRSAVVQGLEPSPHNDKVLGVHRPATGGLSQHAWARFLLELQFPSTGHADEVT